MNLDVHHVHIEIDDRNGRYQDHRTRRRWNREIYMALGLYRDKALELECTLKARLIEKYYDKYKQIYETY
jgi:hypothetical protein